MNRLFIDFFTSEIAWISGILGFALASIIFFFTQSKKNNKYKKLQQEIFNLRTDLESTVNKDDSRSKKITPRSTAYQSLEGYHLVPIRHGLTIGEYALIVNEMGWLKDLARANLTIVPMSNWQRTMWMDDTGIPSPSILPGVEDVESLLAYMGMNLFKKGEANYITGRNILNSSILKN